MSMVARNKQEKAVHVAHLLNHLWHGRTDIALTYLRQEVQAKNLQQLAALVTYLEKHRGRSSIMAAAGGQANRLAVAGWKKESIRSLERVRSIRG